MIWNERIKQLRLKEGLTLKEVAKSLGISEATAQRYENENGIKNIPYESLEKYAALFGVSPSYFMGWDNKSETKDTPKSVARVPVLGYVAAGIPIEEIEDIVDYEEIPAEWLRGGFKTARKIGRNWVIEDSEEYPDHRKRESKNADKQSGGRQKISRYHRKPG